MFIDKYTPNTIEKLIGNNQIRNALQQMIKSNNISNMLFIGDIGTGKLCMARCVLHEYLGTNTGTNSIIIHSGINNTKNIITDTNKDEVSFDQTNIITFIKKRVMNKKLKIIIITEFEQMMLEAQMALRRIMEIYSGNVRFIFTANSLDGIIEAIQSRCLIFELIPPQTNEISVLLTQILKEHKTLALTNTLTKQEKIIQEKTIKEISMSCNGDVRTAINSLGVYVYSGKIVYENLPNINTNINKQFVPTIQELNKLLDIYTPSDVFQMLYKNIARNETIPDKLKTRVLEKILKTAVKNIQTPLTKTRLLYLIEYMNINSIEYMNIKFR